MLLRLPVLVWMNRSPQAFCNMIVCVLVKGCIYKMYPHLYISYLPVQFFITQFFICQFTLSVMVSIHMSLEQIDLYIHVCLRTHKQIVYQTSNALTALHI